MLTPRRLALIVHPTRPISKALATLERWAGERGIDVVQLAVDAAHREVAPLGALAEGDLVVAVGGDGTVLSALRAAAMVDAPVLGVGCGSLGALSAVTSGELAGALERMEAGDWGARSLPALAVRADGAPDDWAVNDFVVLRRGAGQLVAELSVDGELYVRVAGDGVVIATPLGASAYSMAAGGPVVASGTRAFVCTPIAMHGGSAPPLVVPADANVVVAVHPGFGGFDVELDGHRRSLDAVRFELTLQDDKLTLATFGPPGRGLEALRRRGLITDSPRVLARDQRAAGRPAG